MKINGLPDFLKGLNSKEDDNPDIHLFEFKANPESLTDEEILTQIMEWKRIVRESPKEKILKYIYLANNVEYGLWNEEQENEAYEKFVNSIESLTVKDVKAQVKEDNELIDTYKEFIDELKDAVELRISKIKDNNEFSDELKPFEGKHYSPSNVIDLTGLPIQEAIESDPYLVLYDDGELDDEVKRLGASAIWYKDFKPDSPTYTFTFQDIRSKAEVGDENAKIKFKILDGPLCYVSKDALASIDPGLNEWWDKWKLSVDYSAGAIVVNMSDMVKDNDDVISDLSHYINIVYDSLADGSLSIYNCAESDSIEGIFNADGSFGNLAQGELLVAKAREILANDSNRYRKLNNVIKNAFEYDSDVKRNLVENPDYFQAILATAASMAPTPIKHIIMPNENDAIFPGDFRDKPMGALISSDVSCAVLSSTSDIKNEEDMKEAFYKFFGKEELTLGKINDVANLYTGLDFNHFENYLEAIATPIYFSDKYVALFVDTNEDFKKYGFYFVLVPETKDIWNIFVPSAGNPIDIFDSDLSYYDDEKYFDKDKNYKTELLNIVLGQADLHIFKSHSGIALKDIGEPLFVMHKDNLVKGSLIDLGYLIFNDTDKAKEFRSKNGIDENCTVIPLSVNANTELEPNIQNVLKVYLNLTGHLSDLGFLMNSEVKYLLGGLVVDIDIEKLMEPEKEED